MKEKMRYKTEKVLRATRIGRIAVLLAAIAVAAIQSFATVVIPKGEVLPNNSTINEDTVVEELNLASNMAYTVISTATLTIKNVTGGAFRFTAQGYGTVVFEKIDNTEMELNVLSTAHVKFRAAERPAACDNAFFHVDASDETTMSFTSFNGTNFVTRWNDVRGDGRPYAEKNSNANCKGYPFAVNGYLNGRPVVDFGTLWQSGGLRGVGASQVWSEACARPVEVFAVIGDTEDSSANVSGSGGQQYRNNSWFGHTSSTTGYRGNGAVGTTCEILNSGALINSKAKASFTVDGAVVTATTFRPSADSMHVVSWYATDSAYINGTGSADAPMNAFASERNGELGGIRIAEYIVFTNAVLSASDRADVLAYLTRKWQTAGDCDFSLSLIKLNSSGSSAAELALSGGAKVSVGTFQNEGMVTGNGQIVAEREEHSQLTLSENKTIDVPAGSVYAIEKLSDTGYTLVKTGAGKLVVNAADAAKTRIQVEEGVLEFKAVPEEAPTALSKAWFHVDASVTSSLTVSEGDGGTNYVTKWSDVRGAGYPYAERTIGKHDPFISETTMNGLPVVDFGTTWNSSKRDGYGAALEWSEALERPMEIFIVEQHNDDMRSIILDSVGSTGPTVRNQTLLGSTGSSYPLLTGNPDGSSSVSVIGTSATLAGNSYAAQLTVDLESKGAARTAVYHPGYDFHVYGIYMSGATYLSDTSLKAPINAFACERGNIYGGQRIAECVVYTNRLSDAEREAVNTYLYNKWKNGIVVGELEVKAGASVSVPDGSTVRVRILHGDRPAVSGGRLEADLQIGESLVASSSATYDPLVQADAWFHVDASVAESFVSEVREDGTNYVTKWSDVRGAGIYAEQTISKKGAGYDPYVKESALNGLPVMDFGTTWNSAKTDGYGAAMKWSKTLERVMEVFVVEQHNDDMRSIISGSSSTGPTVRNQTILGVYGTGYSSYSALLTGNPDGYDSVSVIGSGATVSSDNYVGRLSVDLEDKGVAKTSNYHPGYDFHLYNVYATGSKYLSDVDAALTLPLNTFACERGNIYGGQRLAECLVFDRVLSADERTFYGNLLYAKWFNGAGGAVGYVNATVPVGVTLAMPYQALTFSGNLEIGGCLKAVSVAPAAITVTGLDAAVDGTLDLGSSGGVITLPGGEWDSAAAGEYRLIAATAISGSIAGWTVELPDSRKKEAGAPVVRSDGIYVSLSRKMVGIRVLLR